MEIQSVSKQSLTVPQLVKAQVGGSRISLPVDGNVIYTNLKHITGFGGLKNQPSYSLNQLRMLDNLIDRLKLLKGGSFHPEPVQTGSEREISMLIDTYRKELHDTLQGRMNPYRPEVSVSGITLDVLV